MIYNIQKIILITFYTIKIIYKITITIYTLPSKSFWTRLITKLKKSAIRQTSMKRKK